MATQDMSAYPSSFPNTSSGTIPFEIASFYDAVLLDRVVSNFIYQSWAQVRDIPANSGTDKIKFRRYSNLSAATTPLTSGVTPAGSNVNVTDIEAQALQYGDFITTSDKISFISRDRVLMEFAEILGDQAADTLDQLTRDILAAGTSVFRQGGHAARTDITASDLIAADTIKKAVRLLANNKARKITEMIAPSSSYATSPVKACYVGICHPNTTYTLKGLTNFIPVEKYSGMQAMPYEVGALDEVRFFETPNAKVFEDAGSGSIDVYATIVLAKNAYGVTRISGQAMQNIVKPLGSAGSADPLNQRATSGWKAMFVAKILNDDFMTRIEHAVAA